MAENHMKHTLHATKRPRAVLTVHREANKNHGRKDEKEIRSPALKKKCMSGRDEGGGGDCNRSKGGRKREDLYVANGVVTCRRLTRVSEIVPSCFFFIFKSPMQSIMTTLKHIKPTFMY